jgi:hypothetical protein
LVQCLSRETIFSLNEGPPFEDELGKWKLQTTEVHPSSLSIVSGRCGIRMAPFSPGKTAWA